MGFFGKNIFNLNIRSGSESVFKKLLGSENSTIQVTNQTALQVSAIIKCLNLIGDGIATMSLKSYEKTNSGRQEVVNPFLSNINNYQTEFDFRKYMAVTSVFNGNSYAYINQKEQTLHPIIGKVEVLMNNGEIFYKICDKQFFPIEFLSDSKLPSSSILHFKGLCVNSPYLGVNPIENHKNSIGLNLSAYNNLKTIYKTNSKKFILETEKGVQWNATTQKEVKDSIEKVLNNQSNTVTVPSGVVMKAVSLTPQEAEYLASIKATEYDIALIFNVPPSMVVRESQGVKSTVEQAALDFLNLTLLPLSTAFEQELKRKLITKPNQYFKHSFNSLLRADAAQRAEFYNKGVNNMWLNANQVRQYEDMATYEGGDQFMGNAANIPMDKFGAWIDAKITSLNSKEIKNNNPNGQN